MSKQSDTWGNSNTKYKGFEVGILEEQRTALIFILWVHPMVHTKISAIGQTLKGVSCDQQSTLAVQCTEIFQKWFHIYFMCKHSVDKIGMVSTIF